MIDHKIIKTEQAYEKALARVEEIMDAAPGTPEMDELELLTLLVETYEDERYPMELADPIDAIKFRMEQQGLTRRDMQAYLGSQARVSEVLRGKRQLSKEMMRKLHSGLGIPAEVLLREPGRSGIEPRKYDPAAYPFREMYKRGYLPYSGTLREARAVGEELLDSFYSVLGDQARRLVYCRHTDAEIDERSLEAWQVQATRLASQQSLPDYTPGSVSASWARNLVRLSYHRSGPTLVPESLALKGIHFLVLPHLPKTRLDGACFFTPEGHPVIALTLRYDRRDNFWFTLAHELGHLVLHLDRPADRETVYMDELDQGRQASCTPQEQEANTFAADLLIPNADWERASESLVDARAIQAFAEDLGISPAIVAGRVRWERDDYTLFNQLLGSGKVRVLFPDAFVPGVI